MVSAERASLDCRNRPILAAARPTRPGSIQPHDRPQAARPAQRLVRHCIDAFNRGKATSPQRSARGDQVGANPADRAKPGFKLHLAVEGGGLPLSLLVTRANTNDSLMFEALLDDIPACAPQPASGAAGHRSSRPTRPTTIATAAAISPAAG